MAAAMARGWATCEGGPAGMLFCDLDRGRAEALAADVGGETREDLSTLVNEVDALVLAVKPAALDDVASELDRSAPAVVSVLAATPLERLRAAFPDTPLLRLMPNQPVEVRRGVICHPPAAGMPAEMAERLLLLLGMLGTLVEIPEERIDAAMAVMSCSPAYAARFAGTLAAAGTTEGLDAAQALELVAGTMAGTAALLAARAPDEVARAVAPPGGATEAGLNALTEGGFDTAIEAAVSASLERFR